MTTIRSNAVVPLAATVGMIVLGIAASTGCHRQFYRKQADCEAHALIAEKSSHVARPPSQAVRIEVDRRSRMFNPFDLDFQPMPLDDPSSYQYMQCVDGRRGYPMWEAAGLTNTTESPDWWQFLPLNEDGVLVLNLENSVQIALLHSPEYQAQVEQLYLSALQVSAERFQFDTQFFGGGRTFLTADGSARNGGGGASSTRFEIGPNSNGRRDLALQRSFATGGELVAGVANSIVWELSGPNSQSASTVLDFSLIQPLLRRAGRDRVLEDLTFAERALLANVRSFERFRRSFFLNVTIGRSTESTLRTGGFSAGGLGNNVPNANVTNTGNVGGYLGLLQTELRIRNLEENIARQAEFLLVLEDTLIELLTKIPDDADSIVRQRLQVAQARSSLLRSQSDLVNQQANYQRSVDAFLRTLGLPPYICAKLDDPFLDQFELIDRTLLLRREELSLLRSDVGVLNVAILERTQTGIDPDTKLPSSSLEWSEGLKETLEELRKEIEPLAEFNKKLIDEDLPSVAKDIETFNESLGERQKQNKDLMKVYETEQQSICGLLNVSEIDESIFEIDELEKLAPLLQQSYDRLEKRFQSYNDKIAELQETLETILADEGGDLEPDELATGLRDDVILASQNLLADLGDDVLALQLIQARARTEKVVLPSVDIAPETAFEIARKNRRDLANAKAALVDTWRAIEVVADDLESTLDLEFSGDVQNVGNNPLDLRSNTGRLRVGLRWDAPITRLLERNAYRTSLIRYEQAKRSYYGLEDSIWQLLRAEIRQLQANRLTFELGRQSVRIAAQQIELNADIREINDSRGRPAGPTAARDAISALSDLLDAQNGLLNIFVNYEVVRRGLDFDLGTMELTPEGLWIEPGELEPELLLMLPGTTAGGMVDGQCTNCCLPYNPLPPEPSFKDFLQTSAGIPVEANNGLPPEVVIEAGGFVPES
ncbi:hypothetical protein Poly51_32830 [Rubripirellula tenax]|uniref:Outer membrane efflux protein n=1 Tax=Rubripirellula tenax TaxID=2528015 RepID=A0A5C6F1U1_9BACT|nr:hypothetical protein [Rubripirellula tenax]TWU54564.1 hypothetical protein Poly51_32830 [Rubripirellula tenax]